jgi:erythromycin esterase-like protein
MSHPPPRLALWLLTIPSILIGWVCAMVGYLILSLMTSSLLIILPISAAAFLGVCYGLARRVADSAALKLPSKFAFVVSGFAAFLTTITIGLPTLTEFLAPYPGTANMNLAQALKSSALPLQTVRPAAGFVDLQPIKSILDGRRIVALGEATHGTSEFFRMKHRMIEFLANEMGFTHFGMELSPEDGKVINDYIQGRQRNPRSVLYWPWATVEVMAMIDWMRAYNADRNSQQRITFHGFDPRIGERDPVMAKNISQLLTQAGPESKIVLWAHNGHISNAPGSMGNYLKKELGNQIYLLGFEFSEGEFTSRMFTVHTYSVTAASPAYYANALARLGTPILFLDFQTMARRAELREWLAKPQSSHHFQELHAVYRLNPNWHTLRTSWLDLYDGVIFIRESTPAVGLFN